MTRTIQILAALSLLAKNGPPRRNIEAVVAFMDDAPSKIKTALATAIGKGFVLQSGCQVELTPSGRCRLLYIATRSLRDPAWHRRALKNPGGVKRVKRQIKSALSEQALPLEEGKPEVVERRVACLRAIAAQPGLSIAEAGRAIDPKAERPGNVASTHVNTLALLQMIERYRVRRTKTNDWAWSMHPTAKGIAALAEIDARNAGRVAA
jgi:hypothetical protein